MHSDGAQIAQAPSQNSRRTLRLTANEFADPPAAIDCYKPLYEMHLSSEEHSTDCDPLGSITIDFEGAWAQKWGTAKHHVAPLSRA